MPQSDDPSVFIRVEIRSVKGLQTTLVTCCDCDLSTSDLQTCFPRGLVRIYTCGNQVRRRSPDIAVADNIVILFRRLTSVDVFPTWTRLYLHVSKSGQEMSPDIAVADNIVILFRRLTSVDVFPLGLVFIYTCRNQVRKRSPDIAVADNIVILFRRLTSVDEFPTWIRLYSHVWKSGQEKVSRQHW